MPKAFSTKEMDIACVGCGACASRFGCGMVERNGFTRPEDAEAYSDPHIADYCPVLQVPEIYDDCHWGRNLGSYFGRAADPVIRLNGSSGGVLTACLCYLLENELIDAVIQIAPAPEAPLFSRVTVNRSVAEVRAASGSRYVSSSALECIDEVIASDLTYAFVGRPCEVRCMRNLMQLDQRYAAAVAYTFSFFCAGAPSRDAVRRLDERLNPDGREVVSLRYRGDGWPGFATERFADGGSSKITYDESWGRILGRDLEAYCRFCFDGVGEYADVSAGDAWYQTEDGGPDFSEHEGRNIVFARTEKGAALLQAMAAAGALHLEAVQDLGFLEQIQKYQFNRKATLQSNLLAMRLLGRKTCTAKVSQLGKYAKKVPLLERVRYTLGLAKRLLRGRVPLP